MSLKSKIQALITAANAKTGKGDTDLTTAVQSLISESGGITPSGNKAITATTSTQTDIDVTNYATVSVAPTPSETKSVTTNGDVTPSSGKLLSKVTVNVPTGEARNSSDLTVSGATVNVPAGLYSSAASKSVASGTAGTPTASKGAVSNNSITVTPSVTNTTGYIAGGTQTGEGVTVSASELVSGNKTITPSETAQSGIDVTNFKTVSVGAISSTYVGSGVTKKAAATVAPSTSEQTVCASGVYTTGEQKVSAITPSIVGNLDASSFVASIVTAIEGKGVTVPDGTKLDGLAALIQSIQTSGAAVTEISFVIEDAHCTANAGQTFYEWIGSDYKYLDNGMVLSVPYGDEGVVFIDEGCTFALSLDGNTPVYGGDEIISDGAYVSMSWSGSPVKQISFSLQVYYGGETSDYGTFTATSGATWADWIGDSYTFDDGLVLIIDSNGHVVNNEGLYELQYGSTTVNGSDKIISGATYTLFHIAG